MKSFGLYLIKFAFLCWTIPVLADGQRAPYELLYAALEHLASEQAAWAQTITYGSTPGGRSMLLIKLARPDWDKSSAQRPAILMTGAIHGNEYLAIEHRLAAWLIVNRTKIQPIRSYLEQGGVIYIVPIANPDGYERNRRTNNHGIDLNRDFFDRDQDGPGFRQPESRALVTWLDAEFARNNVRLQLSVDYHCCASAILYPWTHDKAKLTSPSLDAHLKFGGLIQAAFDPSYMLGASSDVLGYHAKGTAKDYYHAKYGAVALTFEGKKPEIEARQFGRHQNWWLDVLTQLTP